jgi:hypothetical protein
MRDHTKQLRRVLFIRGNVVVPEIITFPRKEPYSAATSATGAHTQRMVIHHDNRAEIAAVWASPGDKEDAARQSLYEIFILAKLNLLIARHLLCQIDNFPSGGAHISSGNLT